MDHLILFLKHICYMILISQKRLGGHNMIESGLSEPGASMPNHFSKLLHFKRGYSKL